MQENPYQSPAANIGGQQSLGAGGVSPGTVDILVRTRPWTVFLAVLGFIGSGLIGLVALLALAGGASVGGSAAGAGAGVGLGGLVMAAIYVIPAVRLWQYSTAISYLRGSPTQQALESALDRQRSFWKIIGVMTLIMIGLWLIIFVIALSVGSSVSRYNY